MVWPVRALKSSKVSISSGAEPLTNRRDRKSTRLNSSHLGISYAVFCLKKKKKNVDQTTHYNNKQKCMLAQRQEYLYNNPDDRSRHITYIVYPERDNITCHDTNLLAEA